MAGWLEPGLVNPVLILMVYCWLRLMFSRERFGADRAD